jgi:hypothetical protein
MHLCLWTLDLLFAIFVFCLIWLGLQVETYFEWSCRSVERDWRFLLGGFGVILCNVNVGEFGVALCSMHLCLWTLDLLFAIFVFCLGLQVGTWGGVVHGCRHIAIANGQSLFRLGFNSSSSEYCSVFVAKCLLPLINSDSQIMLCTFFLVTKSSLLI